MKRTLTILLISAATAFAGDCCEYRPGGGSWLMDLLMSGHERKMAAKRQVILDRWREEAEVPPTKRDAQGLYHLRAKY